MSPAKHFYNLPNLAKMKTIWIFCIALSLNFGISHAQIPGGFVYLHESIPGIEQEVRYAGSHNFTGKPVKGYHKEKIILSKPAAKALKKVQQELDEKGYTLKVFDAYRPQQAVNSFMVWAKKPEDTLAKAEFYPEIDKKDLFQLGYIASKSGHTRGSAIDLTIIDKKTGKELDMGSPYDFFGKISHHDTDQITEEQKHNREFLKNLMLKHGFNPYPEEWWHYSLKNEPYPDTYFDFPVE